MRRIPTIAILILLATPPATGFARQFPTFGGAEARVGVAWPEDARAGASVSVDVDLGGFVVPGLRVLGGWNRFTASVDRRVGEQRVGGSLRATGLRAGVRLGVPLPAAVRPYGLAALTGYSVSANVDDPGTEALLEGFYVGASLGGGIAYGLLAGGRIALSTEVRRTMISNIGHWAAEVGLRLRI